MATGANAPAKNLLMISVDDMIDIVRYGSILGVDIETPALDRLMGMGVTFQNSFTPVPLCSPARAATMTGQSPFVTGIQHNRDADINHVVDPRETVVGALHEAGFYTAMRGKLFHGNQDDIAQWLGDSLDEYGGMSGYLNGDNDLPQTEPGNVDESGYSDAITADWAANFLETHNGSNPFALFVGIHKPHLAWDVPKEYFDLYDVDDIVPPDVSTYEELPDFLKNFLSMGQDSHDKVIEADAWPETIRAYLAAISFADAQVGKILDSVDWDTTTVVFFSDHGYHLGDRELWKKFTLYEEAASVPLVIADPDLARGTTVSSPASLLDIVPTVASLLGVDVNYQTDGIDLFGGEARDGVLTTAYGSVSIRTEEWRYTIYQDGTEELFSVKNGELFGEDVSSNPVHASIVDDMRDMLVSELSSQYDINMVLDKERGTMADETWIVVDGAFANGKEGDDFYFVTEGSMVQDKSGYDGIYVSSLADRLEVYKGIEYAEIDGRSTVGLFGNSLGNTLVGNGRGTMLHGRQGKDTIYGNGGNDVIRGGGGRDVIDAGEGKDSIRGDGGKDILTGGEGADTFIFKSGDGADLITDFDVTEDRLICRAGDFSASQSHAGLELDFGSGDVLTLKGLTLADLPDIDMFLGKG